MATFNPYEKIIVALDNMNKEQALALVSQFKGRPVKYKIGMELFAIAGLEIVQKVHDSGAYVFFDQKYKDIVNTVKGASKAAANLKVDLFNVHAMMGLENLKSAKAGVVEAGREGLTKVIAVTLLTDHDKYDLKLLGINEPVEDYIIRLANLAKHADLDGVVSSPRELPAMRYILGDNATLITPGIQPAFAAATEQKRVTTPAEAIENGADKMVIGRAITKAENPSKALDMIAEEIRVAMPNHGIKTLSSRDRTVVDETLRLRNMEIAEYYKSRSK